MRHVLLKKDKLKREECTFRRFLLVHRVSPHLGQYRQINQSEGQQPPLFTPPPPLSPDCTADKLPCVSRFLFGGSLRHNSISIKSFEDHQIVASREGQQPPPPPLSPQFHFKQCLNKVN